MQSLLRKSIIKKYIIEIEILIILEHCVRTLEEILIVGAFSHTVLFLLEVSRRFLAYNLWSYIDMPREIGSLIHCCGTIKWFSHFVKQSESSQKVKLYDYI